MPLLKSATVQEHNETHIIIEVELLDGIFNKLKTVLMHKELKDHNTYGWKRFDDGYVSFDNCHSLNAFISTGKVYMEFLIQ